MRDLYETLGIARTASEQEVKSAFRTLAKQFHPDSHPTDPHAKEKFARINVAYEILGDKETRVQYERGYIGDDGKPRTFTQADPPKRSAERMRPQPEAPTSAATSASKAYANASNFTPFDFNLDDVAVEERPKPSPRPPFEPHQNFHKPSQSQYQGQNPANLNVELAYSVPLREAATGTLKRLTLPNGKAIDLDIPKGVHSGHVVCLKGQGWPSNTPNGKAGDALITIEHGQDKPFRLEGTKAYVDVPITLDEALLGTVIRVPGFHAMVDLTIPSQCTGREILRMKGQGWPLPDGTAGDLYANIRIILPENDGEILHLAQIIRQKRPYNPRGIEFRKR